MRSTQAHFLDNLVSAVRENPLAAVLIGGGALWLLAGNEKLKSAATSATAAVSPLVDISARNVRAAAAKLERTAVPPTEPDMDHEGSFQARERLQDAASSASDAVSDAASKLKNRYDDGVGYARQTMVTLGASLPGKDALANARSSLADVFEQQPLVLGVVGLAIGAVVAGAFQTIDLENEWLGEISDNVKADLSTRAGAVSQSLRESADTLKAELSDAGEEALDRLKHAGMDAASAAREKVTSR